MTVTVSWSRRKHQPARIRQADYRVAAWAHWQRSSGIHLSYPPGAPFARLMLPGDEENQVGARFLAPDAPDWEAMQVDRILAHWRIHRRRRFRIVKTEFLYAGPAWEKAARHGLKRDAWRERVNETLGLMADELGIA